MVMRTLNLVARHRAEYRATRSPRLVTAGPGRYLALAGCGEPGGEELLLRAEALQAMARAVRAATRARGKDFRLPPIELLRRCEAPCDPAAANRNGSEARDPAAGPAGDWSWKLLLRVPNFVKARDLSAAAAALLRQGRGAGGRDVKVEELKEGRCVQALHVGRQGTEWATIDRMRRAAADLGLAFRGKRHEIWLTHPGRASPERMRTIQRQPVRAVR
jgi:hypothetical protein